MQSTVNPSLRRSTTVRHAPLTAMESPSYGAVQHLPSLDTQTSPLATPLKPPDHPHLFDQSREHQNASSV